ncbi:uncharacterized protein LOC105188021 [Harpegnathos saltator]|uniref:Uncharacterized protein n=1 Tax=Harpegnathos saltator TaxID=610380 RepID=E2BYP5_HARSA|nr:uncharacterized protein LOC105188021 [Harpegnathos saltator]EFN79199.1 hypothetical protein EAI_10194 [Harpegnathos saltator]
MFLERVCLISAAVFVAVSAAPKRVTRSTVPTWHVPCGEDYDVEVASWEVLEEETMNSLESLRLQHQLLMGDYLSRDYNYLYERVDFSVKKKQYIPNWLPDKKDVDLVKRLANASPQTIVNHFPKLHTDLQKFAVAFEQLVKDEDDVRKWEALRGTQTYLNSMLCEVESNILALPSLRLPTRVQRSIMSERERILPDETNRLVRDWGVILKYQDYLHAWRHVFNY